MGKFSEILLKESVNKFEKITILCRDVDDKLVKILNAIKDCGNVGHSFEVVVDPEQKYGTFDWDGDGSDYIKSIKKEKL